MTNYGSIVVGRDLLPTHQKSQPASSAKKPYAAKVSGFPVAAPCRQGALSAAWEDAAARPCARIARPTQATAAIDWTTSNSVNAKNMLASLSASAAPLPSLSADVADLSCALQCKEEFREGKAFFKVKS
jgi:hypothetical protein